MSDIFDIGIIGMGPAGIGLATNLCNTSKIKNTVCFERGTLSTNVECNALLRGKCSCLDTCNVISGIGGSSTLSGGKFSNYPAGSGLLDFFNSEKELIELLNTTIFSLSNKINLKKVNVNLNIKKDAELFYAQKDIVYKYYDVYQFNGRDYRKFIDNTIQVLINNGLTLFDNTEVLNVKRIPESSYFCVSARTSEGKKDFFIRKLVIAIGSLDIYNNLLNKLVDIPNSSYEVGVRVEVPSSVMKEIVSSHGDLKLKFHSGRTYCVTTNGKIVVYKTNGVRFLEGAMDCSDPTSYTNLAVLIKTDDIAIDDFINKYQNDFDGLPIKQKFIDYENEQNSCSDIVSTLPIAVSGNINNLFPKNINLAIKEFINTVLVEGMGISKQNLTLVAPELKILRNLEINKNFEIADNIFVIGAATGKFRGIIQCFCSGVKCGQIFNRR